MAFAQNDTIAAISSGVGPSARMIVRLSGPAVGTLAAEFVQQLSMAPVQRCVLRVTGMPVPASIYRFFAPRSYTGEDLVEFHLPGNPLLARMLLDGVTSRGARHAEPGEFTARAYFNGRIDLAAAEGVAATIAAQNEGELRAARQLMAGELANQLRPAMNDLADTLALVEAGIDFSEEDINFISVDDRQRRIRVVDAQLSSILADSARFEQLAHEPTIVLLGRPNAGKSTLMNALAGHERAVVSDVAGTTRDVLSAEVRLRRGIVRLIDVAGIEENSSNIPADLINRQMQEHALRALAAADVVVLIRDVVDERPETPTSRPADFVVRSKCDLLVRLEEPARPEAGVLYVSAKTGSNMGSLRHHLDELAFGAASPAAKLALNARHCAAIDEARTCLARSLQHAHQTPETIALDIRDALNALGSVLGEITSDDLLGRVFATFCIGK